MRGSNSRMRLPGRAAVLLLAFLLLGGADVLAQGKVLIIPQPPPPGTTRYPHQCSIPITLGAGTYWYEFKCWDWDITPTRSPSTLWIDEGSSATFSLEVEILHPDATFVLDVGLGGGSVKFELAGPDGYTSPAVATWNVRDDVKVDSGSATFTFHQDFQPEYVVARGEIGACDLDCVLGLAPKPTAKLLLQIPYEIGVRNVPPSVALASQAITSEEGGVVTLSGSFQDPGILDPHRATIDWGDGGFQLASLSSAVNGNVVEGAFSESHRYLDDGVYMAKVCVRDDDDTTCTNAGVTVTNAAPEVQASTDPSIDLTSSVPGTQVMASFELDPAFVDRGPLDTHTATIDWGDGGPVEPLSLTRAQVPPSGPSSGSAAGRHTYSGSGQYQAQVCVTDDEGLTDCAAYPVTVPQADLSLAMADDEDSAGVVTGTNLTYQMTLDNAGPDGVENVTMTGIFPAGVTPLYAFPGADASNPVPEATEVIPFSYDVPGGGAVAIGGRDAVVGTWPRFGFYLPCSTCISFPTITAPSGVAFYTRTDSGWETTPDQVIVSPYGLPPTPSLRSDFYGIAVGVSGDVAVVGAPGLSPAGVDEGGIVYVYRKGENGWAEETTLKGNDTVPGDVFGYRLFVSGDTLAVAAFTDNGPLMNLGSVYIFEYDGNGWNQTAKLTTDRFESSAIFGLRLAVDGDVLVASPGDGSSGGARVLVYGRGASGWDFEQALANFDGTGQSFGGSLDVDGDTILVGAFDRAYVYKHDGATWSPQSAFPVDRIYSNQTANGPVALAGDVAAIGTQGGLTMFHRNGTVWTETASLVTGDGTNSEPVLALDKSSFGSQLIVGDPVRGLGGAADIYAWCPEVAPGVIRCNAGHLAPGDQTGVTAVTQVGCFDEGTVIESEALVTGGAEDPAAAGNQDSEQATTRILNDCQEFGTPPFITPLVTGTPGGRGWYVSDVSVDWDVVDPESDVISSSGCGPSSVLSDSGGVTFACTATSLGGVATNSVTIRRDTQPPSIDATLVSLDAGGAVVEFACQDGQSGVGRCPGQVALPLGATAQTVTGTATDRAGNEATASIQVRGNLPPIANAGSDLDLPADGSCSASVLLDGSASSDPDGDPLVFSWSGPFGTAAGPQAQVTAPLGTIQAGLEVDDGLGGIDADSVQVTVSDLSAPVLASVPADVTVECAGPGLTPVAVPTPQVTDNCTPGLALSPAAQEYPAGTTLLQWLIADGAGNLAGAETRVEVVDTVAPSITAPPDVSVECADPAGTPAQLGQPQVSDVCGLVEVDDDAPALFPPGTTTITWTATDAGGNTASATSQVEVTPAGTEICNGEDDDCDGLVDEAQLFQGYLPPVNADGSSIFRHGRTIPFKFTMLDCAGQIIAGASPTITVLPYADGVVGTTMEEVESAGEANVDNVYRFDADSGKYVYNLSTDALESGKSYLVVTTLEDGTSHEVIISLK